MPIIELQHISKEFRIKEQTTGFTNNLKRFFKPQYKTVQAVQDLSFSVEPGEMVGFIGENGAGKSTTIKMMTGILRPTSGEVTVNGRRPYENRKQNAMQIGVIFGQRSRLMTDLSMEDSFRLYKEIYRVPDALYQHNVSYFVELLDMQDFFTQPVRQLSLGQRMKAELAVTLLHDPSVLFLDEPTIGLDVLAKSKIRDFLVQANRQKGTTTILTSHDMKDLDVVCHRIVMISKGRLLFDGPIARFRERFGNETMLNITFAATDVHIDDPRLRVAVDEGVKKQILFHASEISLPEAISYFTQRFELVDLTVKEPDIEEIVRGVYSQQA